MPPNSTGVALSFVSLSSGLPGSCHAPLGQGCVLRLPLRHARGHAQRRASSGRRSLAPICSTPRQHQCYNHNTRERISPYSLETLDSRPRRKQSSMTKEEAAAVVEEVVEDEVSEDESSEEEEHGALGLRGGTRAAG